jgi:hypothetical protein
MDDPNAPVSKLPLPGPTMRRAAFPPAGDRAGLGADGRPAVARPVGLLGAAFMIFILVTQRPLMAFFRGEGDLAGAVSARLPGLDRRADRGRAQHDRHRHRHGDRRHHRGRGQPDRRRLGAGHVVEVLSGGNILPSCSSPRSCR